MFDKDLNIKWEKNGAANSPLALIHKVNFKIEDISYDIDADILAKLRQVKLTKQN